MVLVVGIGHPLMGDDAVGLLVVEELEARPWPGGVEFVRATTCTPDVLPCVFAGSPAEVPGGPGGAVDLVIVDALEAGDPPGTVSIVSADEIRIGAGCDGGCPDTPVSMHTFSAEHLLASLRLAGVKTRSLTIVGIEPAYTGPVEGLSPQLKMAWSRAIDVCARVVMNYLNSDTA